LLNAAGTAVTAGTAAQGAVGIAGDAADEWCTNGRLTASLSENSPAE